MADIRVGVGFDLLGPISMNGYELLRAVLQNLASDPTGYTPTNGELYFNTSTNKARIYYGGAWNDLGGGAAVSLATNLIAGIAKLSVVAADAANPIVVGDNDPRMTNSRNPTGAAGGDLTDTYPNPTVAQVGGQVAANVADAAVKRHTQNTDTGTTAASFQINSAQNGARVKALNGGTELQIRNNDDSGYADLRLNNLYVEGTATEIKTETVTVADNIIELNSNNASNATNEDGGIAIRRFAPDNVTRRDAQLFFEESTGRWKVRQGAATAALNDFILPGKYAANIGDGSATTFALTHNLGTRDVTVSVYRNSGSFDEILATVEHTSTTVTTVKFNSAPTSNEYRVVVVG